MSRSSYPLKMPHSVKMAAARLAKADGVSLNQFIAVAVAEKVGTIETASEFIQRRAANAKPADLLQFLRAAPDVTPPEEDVLPRRQITKSAKAAKSGTRRR